MFSIRSRYCFRDFSQLENFHNVFCHVILSKRRIRQFIRIVYRVNRKSRIDEPCEFSINRIIEILRFAKSDQGFVRLDTMNQRSLAHCPVVVTRITLTNNFESTLLIIQRDRTCPALDACTRARRAHKPCPRSITETVLRAFLPLFFFSFSFFLSSSFARRGTFYVTRLYVYTIDRIVAFTQRLPLFQHLFRQLPPSFAAPEKWKEFFETENGSTWNSRFRIAYSRLEGVEEALEAPSPTISPTCLVIFDRPTHIFCLVTFTIPATPTRLNLISGEYRVRG